MQLENLPPEILLKIILDACTDGGFTGRSLSLVSKHIHAVSKPAKFHSITIHGVWQLLQFIQLLDTISLHTQPVHHLFINHCYPYDKPTQHLDDGTGIPRKRSGFFGGKWFTGRTDLRKKFLRCYGIDPDLKSLPKYPWEVVGTQLSRAKTEKRRQKTISEGMTRFPRRREYPPWIYPASAGAQWGLMYTSTAHILTVLAPYLTDFASTLYQDPIFFDPYFQPVFPRLTKLNIRCLSGELVQEQAEIETCYPSLRSLTISDLFALSDIYPSNPDEPITLKSLPPTLTQIIYSIPFGLLGRERVETHAKTILSKLGIGQSLNERLTRPHLPSFLPASIKHITFCLETCHHDKTYTKVAEEFLEELTERDERVHIVRLCVCPLRIEKRWMEMNDKGKEIWELSECCQPTVAGDMED